MNRYSIGLAVAFALSGQALAAGTDGQRLASPSKLQEGEVRWTFRLQTGGRTVLRYSMQRSD